MLMISVVSVAIYAIAGSRKGVLVRHIACNVTASFRARATLAFRVPVLSAIALDQLRKRGPPRSRQTIAFAASNRHFRVNLSPRFEMRPFRLHPPCRYREQPSRQHGRCYRHLPLARLSAWQCPKAYGFDRRRVYPPVPAPHSARPLPSHPSLRFSCQRMSSYPIARRSG